jgi:hypothetical protein
MAQKVLKMAVKVAKGRFQNHPLGNGEIKCSGCDSLQIMIPGRFQLQKSA